MDNFNLSKADLKELRGELFSTKFQKDRELEKEKAKKTNISQDSSKEDKQ